MNGHETTQRLRLGEQTSRLDVSFVAGDTGEWGMIGCLPVIGKCLPFAPRVAVNEGPVVASAAPARWALRGVTSYERYVRRNERRQLVAKQPPLGRPSATRAALIPIKKSEAWWALTAEERRAIFEEDSHHGALGMEQLPAVARRLHHGRDLGEEFDFLTWFEYAPEAAPGFEGLVAALRETREWEYVVREVDIRLER